MNHCLKIAMFLIAAYAISTGATAQKSVYRCGTNYSQVPCEGAVAIHTNDTRSKADKADTDKATQRDMKQAQDMQKTRVQDEREALANGKLTAKAIEAAAAKSKIKPKAVQDESRKKKPKHKQKESEFFTAKTAPEKKP